MKDTLYSFDIFDTILIRNTFCNHNIFSIMETNDFIKNRFNNKFRKERVLAERKARLVNRNKTNIYDIYKVLEKKYKLTKSETKEIISLEFETEIKSTHLNKEIDDQIKTLIKNKNKVCLISDMYWPSDFIKRMLVSKNTIYSNIPIFVSCEFGKEKKNGELFKKVKNEFKIEYNNWIHFGDNTKSDYSIPKRIGIKSNLIKPQIKFSFEKNIDFTNENNIKTYGLINELREKNSKEYSIGCSVVAPMVFNYINWVLDEATSKNITHLYFVLRDGYILKLVADILIKNRNLSIKTDYIFGSRIAWRFPLLDIEKINEASRWDKSNWIFRDPCYAYICYERLGFSKNEIIDLFGEEFANKKLTSFKHFKKSFSEALLNKDFVRKLENNIKLSKEFVVLYLNQTINFDEKFALVDTNSTGKSQIDLNKLLSASDNNKKISFFYHTYLSNHIDNNIQFAYIKYVKDDMRFPEALFRAPYNTCYRYENKSGKISPVLFKNDFCAWNGSFSYDDYLRGIVDFCKSFEKTEINNCEDYSRIINDVVNFRIKSRDLYKIFAKIPFNPDLYGAEKEDFYPELHLSILFHPFTKLIYFPKGSYYCKNRLYQLIYNVLFSLVSLKRRTK